MIECLDRAKAIRSQDPNRPIAIADVCTGSGCIAITVAKHLPNSQLKAIDVSPDAVAIAKANIEAHQVASQVELIQANLLDPIENDSLDFVLTNPPYVSESEFEQLDKTVRNHEPKIALVSGPTDWKSSNRLSRSPSTSSRLGGGLCASFPR